MKYKTKILLAIFLVSTVLLAAGALGVISLSKEILYERTTTKTDTIGKILAEDARRDFSEGIFTHIQGVLETADAQPNIEFVFIVDRNGNRIIYSSRADLIGKLDPYKDTGNIRRTEKNIYVVSFPIGYEKNNFFYAQLGYSLTELNKDLENIEDIAVYVNAGLVVFILLVSWFIAGRLLAPLSEMKSAANEIAKGNFSPRLAVNSKDIIGDLALSLNNMAGQLDGLTNNLNQKIADATVELRKVNEELSRKTAELEGSNRKLKELDKLKTEFVSTVSHELRTPLTAMIGFSNTILKLKLSEEQKEKYLNIIGLELEDLSNIQVSDVDIHTMDESRPLFEYRLFFPSEEVFEKFLDLSVKAKTRFNTNFTSSLMKILEEKFDGEEELS